MNDISLQHKDEYGVEPQVVVTVPATVSILGEHTEQNHGFVLAAAIDMHLTLAVSFRQDNALRFKSVSLGEKKKGTLGSLKYKREDRWGNYIKGVTFFMHKLGADLQGMDFTIDSDIPPGIGLGSSAALCMAATLALNELYKLDLNNQQLILASSRAEIEFCKIDQGVHDHVTCLLAKKDNFIYIDTRSLEVSYYPFNSEYKLIITHTSVPQHMGEAEFDERKADTIEGTDLLAKPGSGLQLRDFNLQDVQNSMGAMPEQIRRSCLFIMEEIYRTRKVPNVLKKNDYERFGKYMNRSHEGLRDLFELSCPEVDWLVKRSSETNGILGARLTGTGIPSCSITLMKPEAMEAYSEHLEDYDRIFGFKAVIYPCVPNAGGYVIKQ